MNLRTLTLLAALALTTSAQAQATETASESASETETETESATETETETETETGTETETESESAPAADTAPAPSPSPIAPNPKPVARSPKPAPPQAEPAPIAPNPKPVARSPKPAPPPAEPAPIAPNPKPEARSPKPAQPPAEQDYAARLFDPLDPARSSSDWRLGAPRWFVSGIFDTGFIYVRPRFSAGWGRPHFQWVGFDANPLVSGGGAGGYFGVRGALPAIDLRIGGRYFHTFERSYLCPTVGFDRADRCEDQPAVPFYDIEDIESRIGPQSIYLTLESELTVNVPLGAGRIISEVALSAVTGVPDGYFVFEETIKMAIEPPWVWRGRLGYAFPVDRARTVQIGVVGEFVQALGREVYAIRGGITGRVRLYANLEARGIFIPLLKSEDEIGAAGADTFLLGLRYRWATE